jgi:hypothetical protein
MECALERGARDNVTLVLVAKQAGATVNVSDPRPAAAVSIVHDGKAGSGVLGIMSG